MSKPEKEQSESGRNKKLLELLDDPAAIQDIMEAFNCDEETARELWERFREDLIGVGNKKKNHDNI